MHELSSFVSCFPQLFDGSDNSSAELTPDGGFKGSSAAPNTTFTSTGPVVFALFHSSLVQTAGNFTLDFDLGKGDDLLGVRDNGGDSDDTGQSSFTLYQLVYLWKCICHFSMAICQLITWVN